MSCGSSLFLAGQTDLTVDYDEELVIHLTSYTGEHLFKWEGRQFLLRSAVLIEVGSSY